MFPCAALAVLLLASDVHTVHPDGDADFLSIQAAIDASQDGDTIIVRVPDDPFSARDGFTIDGKELTIEGLRSATLITEEGDSDRLLVGPVLVRNLAPSQTVTLRGLQMNIPPDLEAVATSPAPGLRVAMCGGAVRIENCLIRGPAGAYTIPSVDAHGALDLTLTDSVVIGGELGNAYGARGHDGIHASGSRLAIYRSVIRAGFGKPEFSYNQPSTGGDGGTAITLLDRSFLWLGLSDVDGGHGGYASCAFDSGGCMTTGGEGGDGVVIEPASLFVRLESTVDAGLGGSAGGGFGNNFPGADGASVSGAEFEVPGAHRDLSLPPTIRSGEPVDLRVTGSPGESAILYIGRTGSHRYFGWRWGVFLAADIVAGGAIDLGVIPSSGLLDAQVALPAVASDESATLQVQVACKSSPTRFRMTPVRTVRVEGVGTPCTACGQTVYLDASAPPGGNGDSWANAQNDLRVALRSLPWCEGQPNEVWLAQGTYRPSEAGGAQDVPFAARGGLRLLGGFAGDETTASERDPKTNVTVLDGDLDGDDLPGANRSDNAQTLISGGTVLANTYLRGLVLDGLTLRGAQGGPAVSCTGRLQMRDCLLYDNHGGNGGGLSFGTVGINPHLALDLELFRCRFIENTGTVAGAAVIDLRVESYSTSGARPTIRLVNCEIVGNRAESTTVGAGAIRFGGSWPARGELDVLGCTVYSNSGNYCYSGGVGGGGNFDATFANNIFWQNRCDNLGLVRDIRGFNALSDNFQHNCISRPEHGYLGDGGTDAPPVFADPRGADGIGGTFDDDLRLGPGSPLIDAGHNSYVPPGLTEDIVGAPRLADDPNAPDTGVGGPPVVDIGAHER